MRMIVQIIDFQFDFDILLLVKSQCLKTLLASKIRGKGFHLVLVTIFVAQPHNSIRNMIIVQSKENTLPAVAKSLKPIMVLFDLLWVIISVVVEEISPKAQTP